MATETLNRSVILEQKTRVIDYRLLLEQAQERLRAAEVVLELTSEYQNVLGIKAHIKSLSTDTQREEEVLRMMALAAYKETGDTKPVKGVVIKMFTEIESDEAEAEAWSKPNLPSAFKFDFKFFKKVAVNIPGAPITVTKEPRVQIATDLSGEAL
jgi:hypothetical protein